MTTPTDSTDQVLGALSGVREMLEADGYALSIGDVSDGTAKITVSATPEACADCLAPKAVVSQIMLNDLASLGTVQRIELEYPAESAAH